MEHLIEILNWEEFKDIKTYNSTDIWKVIIVWENLDLIEGQYNILTF